MKGEAVKSQSLLKSGLSVHDQDHEYTKLAPCLNPFLNQVFPYLVEIGMKGEAVNGLNPFLNQVFPYEWRARL